MNRSQTLRTERQRAALQAAADYQDSTDGWYPSMRDIKDRAGIGSMGVTYETIKRLIAAGLLEQNESHSQLRITQAGRDELPIPYTVNEDFPVSDGEVWIRQQV